MNAFMKRSTIPNPERIASLSPALDRPWNNGAVLRWENVGEWPSTLNELHQQLEPGLNPGRSWSRQSPTPLLQFIILDCPTAPPPFLNSAHSGLELHIGGRASVLDCGGWRGTGLTPLSFGSLTAVRTYELAHA